MLDAIDRHGAPALLPDLDLDFAQAVAREVIRAGCAILTRGRRRLSRLSTTVKSPGDITSEIDAQSEQAIFTRLRQAFPDHGFLGEETGPPQCDRRLNDWNSSGLIYDAVHLCSFDQAS
ncbi:inositol monophosphatase family protein [Solidesulfovibrio sp. C21]|uniref:inositol monophosphatase family protein n=1 Tax=Solidesulfovibrio sp. C21 TaxID=3398613 RepID=UPI0039FBA602